MFRRITILISYAASIAIVIAGTIMLVEISQGYSYDLKTGQYSINGILSLTSTPSSAGIYINGRYSHRNTPYRDTLKTGPYSLELRKAGFRTWSKQVDILPFQVLLLDKILLIPNVIRKINLTPGQTPSNLVASPDRNHFAYLTADPVAAVWVGGLGPGPRTKVYTPAPATADHPAETIQSISWSADSSHILVKSDVGGAAVYNLINSTGGSPTNLSDLFKLDLSGLKFSSYDWRELYWSSDGNLRRLNMGDKTASVVLADKVSGFTFAGDRIVYVHTTPLGASIWSMDRSGNNQKQLIESLAESSSYQLVYANNGMDALGVLPAETAVATLYLDIFSANPVSKVVSKSVNEIKFSDNGRYLGFYNTNSFGSYDLNDGTILKAPNMGAVGCFGWFDNVHVILCRQGEVDVAELDGSNLTKVVDSVPGASAFGGGDLRHVYTIGPLEGASAGIVSAQVK